MSDNDQKMTEDHADDTAKGLRAWDAMMAAWLDAGQDADETRAILNRARLAGGDGWQASRDALRLADEYDALEDGGPWDAFTSDLLEAYAEARVSMSGEVTATALVYLLGFGGPNVRARYDEGETVTVLVDWWGSHASRTVHVPALAAWMAGELDTLDAGVNA